jgi:transcriptional regulator of acetoin/glycerol metabolism
MIPHTIEVMLEGMAESKEAPTSRELFVAYVVFALKASNWSKGAAAKRIGIGRASMYRLVLNPDVQNFAAAKGWLTNI